MWIGGVDEAGYGPSLGPLVSSVVAFRFPRGNADGWRAFGDAVRRPGCAEGDDDSRAVVGDSKVVYRAGAPGGLAALETSVLAFLDAVGSRPRDLDAYLDGVAPGCAPLLEGYPWYADHALELPVAASLERIAACSASLRRSMASRGAELRVRVSPLLEGEFNRLCASTSNKASALFDVFSGLLGAFREWSSGEEASLVVDRHGGRAFYAPLLQSAYPAIFVAIEREARGRSDYRMISEGRSVRISFRERADGEVFGVALASLFSKYTRELFMTLFNRFWSAQRPGVRPTAGYATDARRFLGEIAGDLDRLGIDRDRLVRAR
jgi:hypothetical protein